MENFIPNLGYGTRNSKQIETRFAHSTPVGQMTVDIFFFRLLVNAHSRLFSL